MIRTGIADIRFLYEMENYEKYYNRVPEFRRQKADRIRNVKKKAQSIGVWVLYEKMRNMWGISQEAVYNPSHSGDYVLCSIDDEENPFTKVGCDLEETKTILTKLVNKYFFPEEQKYIFAGETEEEQKEAFYRYWVLKESFMKATRRGMALGLDTFEIRMDMERPRLVEMPEEIKDTYYFKEYFLDIPYKIGVCSTDERFSREIQKVEL